MPAYEIELMPGQNARMGDDPKNFLYQIREYEGEGFVKDIRFSKVRFDNLTRDAAEKRILELQGENPT